MQYLKVKIVAILQYIEERQINSLHTLFLNYFITCGTEINEISEIRD